MTPLRALRPLALTTLALAATLTTVSAQETTRAVEGGGVMAPGWTGKPDRGEITDAKFVKEGDGFHIVTGPATTYWNSADVASGSYTVKATFTEPQYMNLNDHPHPYGLVVAGNDMGTDQQSYLYCAAYGNGSFIVRGMGPKPFQMNGRAGEKSDAVHQAAGKDQPVTQEIAMDVTPDKIDCRINGTVVASYPASDLVAEGKLKSTDGVYGIRAAHNTEVKVTGFSVEKH